MSLDTIRNGASEYLYPRAVLEECESALVLFAAGFHGAQDAVWVADAGLTATCVDLDHRRLADMLRVYPADWEFVNGDVFEYATGAERQWDVVSLDPPTNLFDRCAELVPLWCLLARKAVVVGCGTDTEIVAPDGWAVTDRLYRSSFRGGVYWAVLEQNA